MCVKPHSLGGVVHQTGARHKKRRKRNALNCPSGPKGQQGEGLEGGSRGAWEKAVKPRKGGEPIEVWLPCVAVFCLPPRFPWGNLTTQHLFRESLTAGSMLPAQGLPESVCGVEANLLAFGACHSQVWGQMGQKRKLPALL